MSSRDVSRWLTKRFGKMSMGHVGTLDPDASGVLPVLIGNATRLQDYLLDSDKVYDFEVSFGYETDTLDASGAVVRRAASDHLTHASIEAATSKFVGTISQCPPLYSAVKYKGRALHKYVRAGQESSINLAELVRKVEVYKFEILGFSDAVARFRVRCGKGTYVRVLAKDLAENLDTCGTVTALCRRQSAGICLEQCVGLEELEKSKDWTTHLLPAESLTFGVPRLRFQDRDVVERLSKGQRVILPLQERLMTSDDQEVTPNEATAQRVLLQIEDSFFGLGEVSMRTDQNMLVAMKRGL